MTASLATARRGMRQAYDHRLRDHVCRTGVRSVGHGLRVPRSTIATWKRRGHRKVVSLDVFGEDREQLLARVDKLDRRAQILAATVRLLLALLAASGFCLDGERLPKGAAKGRILRAIAAAVPAMSLVLVLRIVGLAPARYHAWHRLDAGCGLDDRASCPRTVPSGVTAAEVATIKDMVLAPEYRHMPLRTLSLHAQRIGKVFASVTTWARLIRERGWRRPRLRIHPKKPTIGIRAAKPNELWHIDASIIRLFDGTKVYIHAVIDNYSRKILAWLVAARLDPTATCSVVIEAGRRLPPNGVKTTLMADSGVENVNAAVDATLMETGVHRVLAQVEVTYSNSMIEAFWRSLKHQWLFLNSLDSIERVRTLVAFFVEAHNSQMPHAAFRGQTPDEMYLGTATALPDELAAARKAARARRLATNRAVSCARCTTPPDVVAEAQIPP